MSDRRAIRPGEAGGGVRAAEEVVVFRNQRSMQCARGSSKVSRATQSITCIASRRAKLMTTSPPNILAIF